MLPLLIISLMLAIPSPILTVALVQPTPQEIWVQQLHECENPTNIERVWDTNNQWSYGYLQFQMGTWLKYKKLGTTKQNIGDEEMQRKIATYILSTYGDTDWWTCSRVVRKSLGAFPSS